MQQHFALLGFKVRDKLTGLEGIVVSIAFDISGCVQGLVSPPAKDGKAGDVYWFDTKRLTALSKTPAMAAPSFEIVPGGHALPKPAALPEK